MIDEKPPENRRFQTETPRPGSKPKPAPYLWANCAVEDLLRWLDEIKLVLPPLQLSKLNLEEELLLQFHTVRALQTTVMREDDIPANQRAQVANTVAASLKSLHDMQEAVYTSERFKFIENTLIRCLQDLPEEVAAKFLEQYRKALNPNA